MIDKQKLDMELLKSWASADTILQFYSWLFNI
jgi:hypothetical protein